MKTYVINLDRAADRWARVTALLDKTGISYERVSAVVGKELRLPIPEFDQQRYRWFHGKHPNMGQIGCFLSHIKTLRLFLQTSESFAMICEDDITPVSNLQTVIDRVIERRDLWDIVRLSGFHNSHPRLVCALNDKYSLAVNMTRLCGTGCYLVNRKAAEVLVDQMLPMRVPIDHALDREWFYGLRALGVDPLPVEQNPDELPSSLPPTRNEKLPLWKRYWGVFPYRAYNEATRLVARTKLLRQTRQRLNQINVSGGQTTYALDH